MKTIKNSKLRCTYLFVTALFLTLLLSLLTGIVVAPKPDKPGKPPFEPPAIQYYSFSIKIEGQELDLVEPEYLVVETYADDSGWYLNPTKKTKEVHWNAMLHEIFGGPHPTGDCGKYTTENLENMPEWIDAFSFTINYCWDLQPNRELGVRAANFWEFSFDWGQNPDDSGDYSNLRHLELWTDYGAEAEGTYCPEENKWVVDFNGATWELIGAHEDGSGYTITGGTIDNVLTITIINNGPVTS